MRERQARGLAPTPEEAVVRPHSAALGGRLLTALDVMGSETGGRLLVVHDAFQPAGKAGDESSAQIGDLRREPRVEGSDLGPHLGEVGLELVGRDAVALLGELPHGVGDDLGLVAVDAAGGQLLGDGERVEHGVNPLRRPELRTTMRCWSGSGSRGRALRRCLESGGIVMGQQDAFERILASLHDSMLDDAHWSGVSALLDEACGLTGNDLMNKNPPD